ncbi:MAG: hypothetical protein J6B40_08550 [Oscillospiraceae bacterium]|nr:hypothetical protein [Oscillospiraceae bacterium]MBQ9108992.1 hypothetical protein [Oscillospiraceae bacterium]
MKLEKAEKLMYILIIAMILVGAVITAAESVAVFGFVLCMGLLLAILVIYLLYIRCPHCGEHLGRDRGEFCPHCGKKLRENTPEN